MTTNLPVKQVYVVDDDKEFRNSALLLLQAANYATRGFSSATELLEAQRDLIPGAVLLDVRMPILSGVELLESGLLDPFKFAVVVVTGHGDIDSAVRSLKSGAVDFLEKPFSSANLMLAVEAAHTMLVAKTGRSQLEEMATRAIAALTAREVEVLRGLLAGLQYKQIAHHLDLSARTVEMHREKLLKKLAVRTNAEAVRLAALTDMRPLDG